jgi:hypothetical protein
VIGSQKDRWSLSNVLDSYISPYTVMRSTRQIALTTK